MKTLRVHLLILNYNGADLLRRYLPSFQKAVARSRHACRLSVVDNASRDASAEVLRKEFPSVGLLASAENRVLCSYNEAVAGLSDEVVVLMNNDIEVEEGFIDPLVEPFLDGGEVFFVTPRCLSLTDGSYEGNKTRARIRYGLFWSSALYPGHEKEIAGPGATFQGGFGAFDRQKFLTLGGYDELYLPGRLEDADLCFRAQKRGWKCLYQPASVVYHEGGVSFARVFGPRKTLVINWRNTYLFMWKNLSDKIYLLKSFAWLPVRFLFSLLSGRPELFLGFCEALPRLGQALRRRRALAREGFFEGVPDREIFGRV